MTYALSTMEVEPEIALLMSVLYNMLGRPWSNKYRRSSRLEKVVMIVIPKLRSVVFNPLLQHFPKVLLIRISGREALLTAQGHRICNNLQDNKKS